MVVSTKVKVKQGTVVGGQGRLPNGRPYYFFQGIPYAVPPLRELRFKAPVPLDKFSTAEIDCTKEGSVAFQKDGFTGKVIGSEDCLFLNVYTPETDRLLPVMVYIHGGRFAFGSGNSDFFNPLYLIQQEVVVVTLNYRLGPLGFLSFPEASIFGNAGLKDQRLALQWVQENISQFSGDSSNVTFFGESAGSACVHLHVLSKNSRKVFHKVIMQSGLANMPWAIDDKSSNKAKEMARSLGCTSNDPMEIANFLQHYPYLKDMQGALMTPSTSEVLLYGRSVPDRPSVEIDSPEAVVTRPPLECMNELIDIPVMMGYNSAEGIIVLPAFIEKLEYFANDLRKLIPKNIDTQLDDLERLKLANLIKNFYFKGEALNKETLNAFNDLLSDYFFVIDTNVAAEIHSRNRHKSPLFLYRFDYDGALNLYKKIFKMKNIKGASHADELFYIFQAKMAPEPWEEKAKKMVQTMSKLWTNFAKFSNPTPKEGEPYFDCTWEPVKKVGEKDDIILNAFIIDEKQKMITNPNRERIAFWRNLHDTFVNNTKCSKL